MKECGIHEAGAAERGVERGYRSEPSNRGHQKLWAHPKNKLQDAKNRRMIKADDALKPVLFGGKATNMFEMTKLVNKHLK